MSKEGKRPYWQICMTCNRRIHSAEPNVCTCGDRMIDARDHEDNKPAKHEHAHAKPAPAKPPAA
ncbi:MAG TPA: hypothetical protein VFO46_25300 [Candidatus Sulfotelmatobacter sp.]|nr:hypothetical protein [Candidatus Sulfotelmatobacter sp.]